MTDRELLDAWRRGDTLAGQTLVKRYYQGIYLFFYGKVGPEISEDLTQATFEALCERREGFRGDSALRTYLFGIARFKLVRHFERRHNAQRRFEPLADSVHDVALERSLHAMFAEREAEMLLVQALRRIPLDDQLLLELKDYEGMTARELAEVFGVPAGTIASRLQGARERLRKEAERLATRPGLLEYTLTDLQKHMQGIRDCLGSGRKGSS